MTTLQVNQTIPLYNGKSVTIIEKLGEGGQGIVYRVKLDEQEYALKWYFSQKLSNPDEFYQNLKNNIEKGKPGDSFLWPLYLTEKYENSFGYVMELRPKGYREFPDFLLNKTNFNSISTAVMAALNITNSFRDLHRKGYSYQDLNDGNFFIDPKTGNVLICDNDNVAPYGANLGIAGKPGYKAPEIVRNKNRPNDLSDRFSMAVTLFRLLFIDDPFVGARVTKAPCLTEDLELKFFGKDPIFIMNPDDASNRPVPGIHQNVIRLWPLFPRFIQEAFEKAFSKDALEHPEKRPPDNTWQILLTNLRDNIFTCPACHEETFASNALCTCANCGIRIPKLPRMECKDGKYPVVLFPGNKLYRCHTDDTSDDFNEVTAEVIQNPKNPNIWGLRNQTQNTWNIENKDGSRATVAPGGVLIVTRVKRIEFSAYCNAEITF